VLKYSPDTNISIPIAYLPFQNQPPIGWLKNYKIENNTLLYETVTYVTALLLHIAVIHIYALVVS
jgi:hypothetical protein